MIIFCVVLYGCETWLLILREGHRLKVPVPENKVPMQIFGPKRDENGNGESIILRNCMICPFHLILSGLLNLGD